MAADRPGNDPNKEKNLPGGRFFSPKEAVNRKSRALRSGTTTFVGIAGIRRAALHRLAARRDSNCR
jgi:hypothetical protein